MPIPDLEVPCPACGGINEVPEEEARRQGFVVCRFCGDSISVSLPRGGLTGAYRVPGSPVPPPLGDPVIEGVSFAAWDELTGDSSGPVAGSGPAAAPQAGSVVCPSCGHCFVPVETGEGRPTVLIVEDTEFFLRLATDVLGRRYQTVVARSAAQARQVLATRPVDLVVVDLKLPDGEGADVLRALPRPNIPALIYTSRDETSLLGPEWSMLQALGAQDVVHKGINIEDTLLRKVGDLLMRVAPTIP